MEDHTAVTVTALLVAVAFLRAYNLGRSTSNVLVIMRSVSVSTLVTLTFTGLSSVLMLLVIAAIAIPDWPPRANINDRSRYRRVLLLPPVAAFAAFAVPLVGFALPLGACLVILRIGRQKRSTRYATHGRRVLGVRNKNSLRPYHLSRLERILLHPQRLAVLVLTMGVLTLATGDPNLPVEHVRFDDRPAVIGYVLVADDGGQMVMLEKATRSVLFVPVDRVAERAVCETDRSWWYSASLKPLVWLIVGSHDLPECAGLPSKAMTPVPVAPSTTVAHPTTVTHPTTETGTVPGRPGDSIPVTSPASETASATSTS